MDWSPILTGIAVVGFVYGFLRNFKNDVNAKIDRLERHMDSQDERIFQLATGKSLKEAMMEAKRKSEGK